MGGGLGARARDQGALSQFFGRSEGLYGRRAVTSPTIADAAGSRASANTIFMVLLCCGKLLIGCSARLSLRVDNNLNVQ